MNDAEEEAAVDAVREVIRSKRLFRGGGVPNPGAPSKVDQLERSFEAAIGTDNALAVNSGTSALVCALAGLEIGPGDEVIVPAYTWISTATSVLAVGAVPIFANVDDSLTLDPEDVRNKLSPHTKAIAVVHMRGAAADMDRLGELADEGGLGLIEDTAQAVGASFRGRRLGTIGDVGTFSFQMSKIITAGEGGMVVTDSEAIHRRAAMYHDVARIHQKGISREEWLPGLNLRMSELHAAVLAVQLGRLDELLAGMRARKAKLKSMIASTLSEHGVRFRTLHDPGGDAATTLILLFGDHARAAQFASRLSRDDLPAYRLYHDGSASANVDAHVYADWTPILQKRSWSASGAPWDRHPRAIDYPPDDCAPTVELLRRAVNIDITADHTDTQIEQMAEAIVETVEKLG